MKIAVLGAGAWGTALAVALCARHEVTLWARRAPLVSAMAAARRNPYLPGFPLPAVLRVDADLPAAADGAELILIAVPVAGLRPVLRQIAPAKTPVVWACKGFETRSAQLPHQIAQEELRRGTPCGALSGPSFAEEVARGLPTALTLAAHDAGFARDMARRLHGGRLRLYASDDVAGVETAGAVKNVMAIAAGICDGLELGHNARAALITRGLAEITRLGLKWGGRLETFLGLAGVGDLILTCTGDLSRNRRVGLMLAAGRPLAQILDELGHVAEGVHTAPEVLHLAENLGVEMPITRAVCQVLHRGVAPRDAVEELLNRDPKFE